MFLHWIPASPERSCENLIFLLKNYKISIYDFLIINGITVKSRPTETSKNVFEIKYGMRTRTIPHTKGTTARCLRPYINNPPPIEPKINP